MSLCKAARAALLAALVAYPSSYAVLSVKGKFVPGCIGTNGVKWYSWMPHGFMRNRGWTALAYVYYPLLYVDLQYIHRHDYPQYRDYPTQDYWD